MAYLFTGVGSGIEQFEQRPLNWVQDLGLNFSYAIHLLYITVDESHKIPKALSSTVR